MRFIVYGAGAIGGVVGARLHQARHDVVLVARGAHHDAIRSMGLRLQSAGEDVVLPVPVVSHPREITWNPDDVVLVATKSQDTLAAVRTLSEHVAPSTPLVSLQNGVANERAMLRWFENVYGVCVMSPTAHLEPGVVQAYAKPVSGLLDVGRYPRGTDPLADHVASVLTSATFESVARHDIMRWKHTKLLMNLGNAVQATCPPGDDAAALVGRLRAEGSACLSAAGIAYATDEEDRARRADLLQMRPIAGARRGGGSSWQSLLRGTGTIETDYLNGEIVLLGRLHGVPTPANELVRRLANHDAVTRAHPQSHRAAQLLAQLDG